MSLLPLIVAMTLASGSTGLPQDVIVTPEAPAVTPQVETIDLHEAVDQAEALAADAPAVAGETAAAQPAPSAEPSVGPSAAIPPEFIDASARADVVTERLDVDPFVAVGVTWDAGTAPEDMLVSVRVRENGAWTAWDVLALNDNTPDAGTEEAEGSTRQGTEPLLTLGADGVQVSVDSPGGSLPEGLEVDLIDPGTSDHDYLVDERAEFASLTTGIYRPDVVTRAQWGADESLASSVGQNDDVLALVLHHTAGSNAYSQAQAMQQLRGIYAYHTQSLGWSDIGYNLLIDRYGTVYEGRRGSITGMPRGAHAGGFNDKTYGISVMGNFQTSSVPAVVAQRLAEVVAWKMWDFGIAAKSTVRLTSAGGGTSRYSAGTSVSVSTFAAHRDVGLTACPGVNLLATMAGINLDVQKRLAAAPPSPVIDQSFPKDWDGDGRGDVVATDGLGRLLLYPGNGSAGFTAPRQVGKGWGSMDLITMAGDWDGDGRADIIARSRSTSQLWLYRGDGKGSFLSVTLIGGRWSSVDAIVGVGDWDLDGKVDVLARIRSTGALNLYRGNGRGGFLDTRQIGAGFSGMNELVPAGRFASRGVPAFLAREASSGNLYLVQATIDGGARQPVQIGRGWGSLRQIVGLGNWDGAGGNDVLAVTSDNSLVMYRGTGYGTVTGSLQIGKGWGSLTILD